MAQCWCTPATAVGCVDRSVCVCVCVPSGSVVCGHVPTLVCVTRGCVGSRPVQPVNMIVPVTSLRCELRTSTCLLGLSAFQVFRHQCAAVLAHSSVCFPALPSCCSPVCNTSGLEQRCLQKVSCTSWQSTCATILGISGEAGMNVNYSNMPLLPQGQSTHIVQQHNTFAPSTCQHYCLL